MKRLCAVLLALLFGLSFVRQSSAVTVYYQPTPFPLKKCEGSPTCPGGAMPQSIIDTGAPLHIWNGWLNNLFNKPLVQGYLLPIGGFGVGDTYASLLRFDLAGLPTIVDVAALYLWALPSGAAGPSQVKLFPITSDWSPTLAWKSGADMPVTVATSDFVLRPVSTVVNDWRIYEITPWYQNWKKNPPARPDKGILIWPGNHDGSERFDMFSSSRNVAPTDARYFGPRPMLALAFKPPAGMPDFKMPLSGGASWLLTGEAGGYECMGENPWPDTTHQGNNYFALDFSPTNIKDSGGSFSSPISILATAGGAAGAPATVRDVGGSRSDSRGYYITLDHGNGYQTRYLHFQQPAARANKTLLAIGNKVYQGDQIGIMGSTGFSTATHLHINFWQYGTGRQESNIAYAVMEGLLIKSYQTECSVNGSGVPKAHQYAHWQLGFGIDNSSAEIFHAFYLKNLMLRII